MYERAAEDTAFKLLVSPRHSPIWAIPALTDVPGTRIL
jgi:hypothetical protein